jgi:hypothetical protein
LPLILDAHGERALEAVGRLEDVLGNRCSAFSNRPIRRLSIRA